MDDHELRTDIEKLFDAKLKAVERELRAIIAAMEQAVVLRAELEKTNTISRAALWIAVIGWAVLIFIAFIKR